MRTPVLARVILAALIWVGAYGFTFILFDALGIWPHVSESVTHALDLVTAAILLIALVAHLVLSTGRLPERP